MNRIDSSRRVANLSGSSETRAGADFQELPWRGRHHPVAGVLDRFAPLAPVGSGDQGFLDLTSERLGKAVVIPFGQLGSVLAEKALDHLGLVPGARRDLDPGSRRLVGLPVNGRQVSQGSQVDKGGLDLHLRLVPSPVALDLADRHLASVPRAGDFTDFVLVLDEPHLRERELLFVPHRGRAPVVAGVPSLVELLPQQGAVRRQASIRDVQAPGGQHPSAGRCRTRSGSGPASRRTRDRRQCDPEGPEGRARPHRRPRRPRGSPRRPCGIRSNAAPRRCPPRSIVPRAVFSPNVQTSSSARRGPFPAVEPEPPAFFRAEEFVGRLVDLPLAARAAAGRNTRCPPSDPAAGLRTLPG